jgi:hypothetical protein
MVRGGRSQSSFDLREEWVMAKRGRRCVVPECERQVTPGALVCAEHRQSALGKELGREVALLSQQVTTLERAEQEGEKREAARVFRQQVLRGEYAALFSSKFHEMLQTAGEGQSLQGEIGMLRVAMARVMTEEENPARMAHALAKLSFALGRALKQEGEIKGARELSEDERWVIAMEHLFPPFPGGDQTAEEIALTENRMAVMDEVWAVMKRHGEIEG